MNFDLDVSYKQQQKLVMTQQMKISINIFSIKMERVFLKKKVMLNSMVSIINVEKK